MIGLIATMVSSIGGAAAGAMLKLLGNFILAWMDRKNLAQREQLATRFSHDKANATANANLAKVLLGTNESTQHINTVARSIIAGVSISAIAIMGWVSITNPSVPLLTILPPEDRSEISLLFGLVKFPTSGDQAQTVTLGHLAISIIGVLSMVLSWFFFPAGTRR
tara:strand:- start:2221 stop:2715 length:495 start_codon:yes stop_codon:yes gene_type:complete